MYHVQSNMMAGWNSVNFGDLSYYIYCPRLGEPLFTQTILEVYVTTFNMTRLGPKEGQIGPKWDKSMTFSDQISVHFG